MNRSVTSVSRISAGTRSPAESRTISPTTSFSAEISMSSPSRLTVILSWISRLSCCAAFFARSSWIRRIAPLIRIMEKIIIAVVAFLAKLETRKTSVTNEIIPRIKRIILNGLIKARRNRRIVVSFFRSANLFAPYFSLIASTCSWDRPSGDAPISWYICDASR